MATKAKWKPKIYTVRTATGEVFRLTNLKHACDAGNVRYLLAYKEMRMDRKLGAYKSNEFVAPNGCRIERAFAD